MCCLPVQPACSGCCPIYRTCVTTCTLPFMNLWDGSCFFHLCPYYVVSSVGSRWSIAILFDTRQIRPKFSTIGYVDGHHFLARAVSKFSNYHRYPSSMRLAYLLVNKSDVSISVSFCRGRRWELVFAPVAYPLGSVSVFFSGHHQAQTANLDSMFAIVAVDKRLYRGEVLDRLGSAACWPQMDGR